MVERFAELPDPGDAANFDELVQRLRSLKIWAGNSSYEVITNRINAAWTTTGRPTGELARRGTVVDCFRTGRRRVNTDLMAQPPADPAAVLDSFLRLLGVPGQQIPHDLAARSSLYRERLAGRRALVMLDNAADEGQVEPLLPAGTGCLTLVTSRRSLSGLRSARHLPMDVFSPGEAVEFLRRAVPDIPMGDDPDALARVAHRCGCLPLALGLVTGHMRTKPSWTVTDHADRLDERHRDRRLDTDVELALSLSYQHLPADRRRLLRLLSLHPGHDIDTYAAAALAGTDRETAELHLHQLAADHLPQRTKPGRFVFHDLVRAYASSRASDEDRPRERRRPRR